MLRRITPRLDRSLESVARALAADTAAWLPHVHFGEPCTVPVALTSALAGDDTVAFVAAWLPGQGSGLHEHWVEGTALVVVRGRITETWVDPAGRSRSRRLGRGRVRSVGPGHRHALVNDTELGAVTLHVAPRTRTGVPGEVCRPISVVPAPVGPATLRA